MIAAWLLLAACSQPEPSPPPVTDGDPTPTTDTEPPTIETASSTDTALPPPNPADAVTESFTYSTPPVDVLFVIDASTSMIGNTELLIGALDGVVTSWISKNIDFHVGVVDIDESPTQGRLLSLGGNRWVEPTLPTPGVLLQEMVDAVPDPSTNEMGRATTWLAFDQMDSGEPNEGFLRADSRIAVIIHSDETDQSTNNPVTYQEFVDYLNALRVDPELVAFNAIVGTEDYFDVTASVGGIAWSVTNTPYGPALDAITATIEGNNAFTLPRAAYEDTITARVTEPAGDVVDLANDTLTYDETTFAVDLGLYFPDTGATVEITYVPLP